MIQLKITKKFFFSQNTETIYIEPVKIAICTAVKSYISHKSNEFI